MSGHASAKETLDTYADLFDEDLDTVAVALPSHVARTNVSKPYPLKRAPHDDAEA
jgi:hypothetical protein